MCQVINILRFSCFTIKGMPCEFLGIECEEVVSWILGNYFVRGKFFLVRKSYEFPRN